MVTLRPRERNSRPKLEAVKPFPRDEATPPVTKMCFERISTGFDPINFPIQLVGWTRRWSDDNRASCATRNNSWA